MPSGGRECIDFAIDSSQANMVFAWHLSILQDYIVRRRRACMLSPPGSHTIGVHRVEEWGSCCIHNVKPRGRQLGSLHVIGWRMSVHGDFVSASIRERIVEYSLSSPVRCMLIAISCLRSGSCAGGEIEIVASRFRAIPTGDLAVLRQGDRQRKSRGRAEAERRGKERRGEGGGNKKCSFRQHRFTVGWYNWPLLPSS